MKTKHIECCIVFISTEAALGVLIALDLGEPHESYAMMEEELSPKFAGYQANKMCYSVIWGTEERSVPKLGSVDLTNKQELWLAKLGSWTEALTVYEEKLKREALLEIIQAAGTSLTNYESSQSTKTALQKSLWRDRLD